MVGGLTDANASVQSVLLRGVLALAASLDLPPAVATTPIGYSDDQVAVLPVPSIDHVFNLSDLVKLKPSLTPMLKPLYRRSF